MLTISSGKIFVNRNCEFFSNLCAAGKNLITLRKENTGRDYRKKF
jgi:hypothetical protein